MAAGKARVAARPWGCRPAGGRGNTRQVGPTCRRARERGRGGVGWLGSKTGRASDLGQRPAVIQAENKKKKKRGGFDLGKGGEEMGRWKGIGPSWAVGWRGKKLG
jgi:hypothetical protein